MDHIRQIAEAIEGGLKAVSWSVDEEEAEDPIQIDIAGSELSPGKSPFEIADRMEEILWSKDDYPAYSEIHDAILYEGHILYYGEWGRGQAYITIIGQNPMELYKKFLASMNKQKIQNPADDWEDEFSDDSFNPRVFLNFFEQIRSHQR